MDVFDEKIDYVAEVFKAGGLMAKIFGDGYQPRRGQLELAYAVDAAMRAGHVVMGEGPTGTGKSLAYGVPASYFAARGEKVVIATANIALQEQLVGKDLPSIQNMVPWQFTFALAKGFGNFLCLDKFDDSMKENLLVDTRSTQERAHWKTIVRWASETSLGDVSELPFEPPSSLRRQFTIASEDCTGSKCGFRDQCHAIRARQRVKNASVVVTNYHLFYADLIIKRAGGEGLLPVYSHVIFDEAHEAAEIARDYLGFRMTRGAIVMVARLLNAKAGAEAKRGPLPEIDAQLKMEIEGAADRLFSALESHYRSREYQVRFRRPWSGELLSLAGRLGGMLEDAARLYTTTAADASLTTERALDLHNNAARAANYAANLRAVSVEPSADWIYYLEDEGERIAIKGKPISVAKYLREKLFAYDGPGRIKSSTLTSATLTTAPGEFDYVGRQLGLANTDKISVDSPFDFPKNMLVVVPEKMPEPQSDKFPAAVAERLESVINMARGRTLGLFTSYRVLNAVYSILQARVDYPLLKQGQAPRMQLIESFKKGHSVLLGTESFWTGVDVPGDALSVVVIDKLPFPNVSDPLQDVLKQKLGRRYFEEVSIPAAALALKQGWGRLIRTTTDRGVVVLLDSRIAEKGYGRKFTRGLPKGVKISRRLEDVGEFLGRSPG